MNVEDVSVTRSELGALNGCAGNGPPAPLCLLAPGFCVRPSPSFDTARVSQSPECLGRAASPPRTPPNPTPLSRHVFQITFHEFPRFPQQNNVFTHEGNPHLNR